MNQVDKEDYREMKRIVWINDKNGRKYACYAEDVDPSSPLSEKDKARCFPWVLQVDH